MDEAADDMKETKRLEQAYMNAIKSYRRCLRHLTWPQIGTKFIQKEWIMGLREIKRKLFYPYQKKDKYMHDFLEVEKMIRRTHGKFNFCYFHTYPIEKELFKKDIFANYAELPFENLTIRVPVLYHEYLTQLFGDYMQLPPVNKRKVHYDRNRSLLLINDTIKCNGFQL